MAIQQRSSNTFLSRPRAFVGFICICRSGCAAEMATHKNIKINLNLTKRWNKSCKKSISNKLHVAWMAGFLMQLLFLLLFAHCCYCWFVSCKILLLFSSRWGRWSWWWWCWCWCYCIALFGFCIPISGSDDCCCLCCLYEFLSIYFILLVFDNGL